MAEGVGPGAAELSLSLKLIMTQEGISECSRILRISHLPIHFRQVSSERRRIVYSLGVKLFICCSMREWTIMLKEFREFAVKGNVVDMAVGIIIGGAFGKIVSSLVNDIIMPPIGLLIGKVDFSNLFVDLSRQGYGSLAQAKAAGAPTINYGLFVNNIIDFLVVAFALFLVVKWMNKLRDAAAAEQEKPAVPVAPTTKTCPYCLSEIPIKAVRCAHCTSNLTNIA